MAVQVIATAPFGHALTIQKTATAPMATNARPALTTTAAIGHVESDAATVRITGTNARPPAAPVHQEPATSRRALSRLRRPRGAVMACLPAWRAEHAPPRRTAGASRSDRSASGVGIARRARGKELMRNSAQHAGTLLLCRVLRQRGESYRHSAPAGERRKQAVDGLPATATPDNEARTILRSLRRSPGRAR